MPSKSKKIGISIKGATGKNPRNIASPDKNAEVLKDFTAYCRQNPSMRFWQALRNWSQFPFVLGSNEPPYKILEGTPMEDRPVMVDTFYFEGKNK